MLRYNEKTSAISKKAGISCPPQNANNNKREAWRWTFNPYSRNCFLPVAIRNPARLTNTKTPEEQCSCWALSMHQTKHESISAFLAVEKSFKRARLTLGTHIAKGIIDENHGLSTFADHYGHFDLHPFLNAKFNSTFQVDSEIPTALNGAKR